MENSVINTMEEIQKIAEGVFGEERVWVSKRDGDRSNKDKFDLTIHFPEIRITNTYEHKHLIKDIYVRFPIHYIKSDPGNYQYSMAAIYGTRTTASLKEVQTGYAHSHLPLHDPLTSFQPFCLGSSQFANIFDNLKIYGTEEHWELALLSLPNYLSWESLEGGPHTTMASIAYSDRDRPRRTEISPYDIEQELYRLMPDLPKEVWEFAPDLKLIKTHPSLYEFFNEHSNIRKLINETAPTPPNLDTLRSTERQLAQRRPFFKWKEEKRAFSIYDENLKEAAVTQAKLFEENQRPQIDKLIVEKFIQLLDSKSSNIVKRTIYDRTQDRVYPQIRENASLQQAYSRYFSQAQTAGGLPA